MPAAARPEPEIASAVPAQPQWNSSAEITCIWPCSSAAERCMPSRPPKPCLRASLMTSQGVLSSRSCLAAAGRITSRANFRHAPCTRAARRCTRNPLVLLPRRCDRLTGQSASRWNFSRPASQDPPCSVPGPWPPTARSTPTSRPETSRRAPPRRRRSRKPAAEPTAEPKPDEAKPATPKPPKPPKRGAAADPGSAEGNRGPGPRRDRLHRRRRARRQRRRQARSRTSAAPAPAPVVDERRRSRPRALPAPAPNELGYPDLRDRQHDPGRRRRPGRQRRRGGARDLPLDHRRAAAGRGGAGRRRRLGRRRSPPRC